MSFRRITIADLMGPLTQRKITDEGYLVAPGNLSKAGNVQDYSARELGLDGDGMDANRIVRLYRPVDEVFSPEALKSFDSKPITLTHPPTDVTADNWREYAVGDVTGVAGGGQYMTGTLIIRDKDAVMAVVDGTRQLSCGYSFDLDMTPGKTADGVEYHGVQRNIRGNHHAIVDAARGGPGCRVADGTRNPGTGDRPMATRVIVIDDVSLEMDATQASLVEKIVGDAKRIAKEAGDALATAQTKLTAAETALAEEKAKGIKLVADHAKEVTDLRAQIPSTAQIEALASERAKVVTDALVLVPEFKAEGKTVPAIRAEVLTSVIAADSAGKAIALAVLGGAEPAKAAEGVARAAFDAVVAAHGPASVDDAAAVDAATSRALAGDGGGTRDRAVPANDEPVGRDAMIANMSWAAVQRRLQEQRKQ